MSKLKPKGFTLVELIVAVGLFALIMLLASGAYLVMLSLNRQAQNISNGIDNLSFALESMTRDIRTGTSYAANGADLIGGSCYQKISFNNQNNSPVSYYVSSDGILFRQAYNSALNATQDVPLTDSSIVISSLAFCISGQSSSDSTQARVMITISGQTNSVKNQQKFYVETGATMRGSDI